LISPTQNPPPVVAGDRVGVAALSGPVAPERLASGLAGLRELGYEPVVARNAEARTGLFAGDDRERLSAFHELISDPTLRAVFFVRGGHGLLRVLPEIDWALVGARELAWVGYSDVTPLLLEIVRRFGLTTFHGPMVGVELARGLAAEERVSLQSALAGQPQEIPFAGRLRRGAGEAVLLGGCLSLLTATLGTPYFPDLEDAFLFWEDTNEPHYRVDRMLTHLRVSGSLRGVKGMIVGSCNCSDSDPQAEAAEAAWLESAAEIAAALPGPSVWGLPAGHDAPNWTLPLGRVARILSDEPRLLVG
jgi:muramoyltetrapeptide carboxypeptidase